MFYPYELEQGTQFLVTDGSYRDYRVCGLFTVVKNIDLDTLEKYFEEFPDRKVQETPFDEALFFFEFIWWLQKENYSKRVEYYELHATEFSRRLSDFLKGEKSL